MVSLAIVHLSYFNFPQKQLFSYRFFPYKTPDTGGSINMGCSEKQKSVYSRILVFSQIPTNFSAFQNMNITLLKSALPFRVNIDMSVVRYISTIKAKKKKRYECNMNI